MLANAATARRSTGVAARRPSVKISARPSSSRSHGQRRIRRTRARSPRRGRRRAGCRPAPPGGRRTAPRPTRRGTCRARGARRASRASVAACEQQQRRVAAAVLGERDLGPEQIHAGPPELVERPGLRGRQQPARHVERPRPQAGLGGGERPVGSPRGIAGQRDRALQERGRGGEAAARLRPARRALELARDLLVRTGRRGGQVPCATIRIDVAIRRPPPAPGGPPGAPAAPADR